jgi:hypothetical protein
MSTAAMELAAKRKATLRAMDRSALETLLLQQLISGTLSDVDLTLAASCSDANSLGLLEGLSDDLLLRIVDQLDTKTRLQACTIVCKRLRALHFSVSLWRDIRLSPEWINDDGLRRLAHWLPDRGAVHSLTLERYNWGEAAAHEFVASFGGLQSLALSGAIKTHLALSFSRLKFSSLREFCFDPMGNMGDQNIVRMLAGMPALRVLKLCESQLTDKMILSVVVARDNMATPPQLLPPTGTGRASVFPPHGILPGAGISLHGILRRPILPGRGLPGAGCPPHGILQRPPPLQADGAEGEPGPPAHPQNLERLLPVNHAADWRRLAGRSYGGEVRVGLCVSGGVRRATKHALQHHGADNLGQWGGEADNSAPEQQRQR